LVVRGGLGSGEIALGAVVVFHHPVGIPNQRTEGGEANIMFSSFSAKQNGKAPNK